MQKSTNSLRKPVQIDILVFEQFSNHCLANALEPFRAANTLADQKLYQWKFFTPDGQQVTSSSGLPIIPDAGIDDRQSGDMLFIVSSYGHRQLDAKLVRKQLVQASRYSKFVVGLDTGAWLMAGAGLLDGYRATVHPDLIESLSETFLKIDVVRTGFVIDGARITCGGAMAAFDLMLELIGNEHGQVLKMDLASLFLHGGSDLQSTRLGRKPNSTIVEQAIVIMRNNIETPLTIVQICKMLDCNVKYLERCFQKQLNKNPAELSRHLRLTEARRLIENTDLPVTEVAVRSGYENASAMTRAFSKKFGQTPSGLRKAI